MKIFSDFSTHKRILKIALPAIAGLSTQMIVSLVDTAMVGRLPEAQYALAAMGLGVLATWAIISFFSSLATGTHILVARKFGSNDFENCAYVLNTSLIISLIVGLGIGTTVVLFAYDMADLFAKDVIVGQYAGEYLHYRFMGLPFFLITVSYRGFFFGIGKTKIFMFSGILANLLNIIFNYIFIFGAFGIESMGLAGAGLGSTLATACDALFYFIISLLPYYKNKYKFFKLFKLIPAIAKSIIRLSLPVSLQNVFILIGFLSFVAITGLIGTLQQAASQVVISSLFISIMPCFGFGIAIQTLVGNNLGKGDIKSAKYYSYETSKLATIYTVIVGIVFTMFPRMVLILITTDETVIETAIPALRIAGFGQIFYAIGVVLANGLQAAGQTFFVMMTEVIINWVLFIPLSYYLGITLGLGLRGAWFAIPIYVFLYSLVILLKFKFGDWSKFKKIDNL
ncbi:MAG: MATE family efflux transporter [Melioribacteraceae bacterium]|nr:MATE family efflux transporter [Melioribacteraceae bacterium]MCF8395099.1 MATE family efflux transporter [Melioribacteraceae bacterium]MCF8420508.1 MATE family efflux transporter [Melioribacteraceae bacterium]